MKKFFFVILFLIAQIGYSQYSQVPHKLSTQDNSLIKAKYQNSKIYGDTLWYEDFDGGLPACWSIVNNNANSFDWQWDTIYRPGAFSSNLNKINSTTSGNGFMLLPMDQFNTPIPPEGAVAMDTYFESCAIPLVPHSNVALRVQQFSRYCCGFNKSAVQISIDNFQTFDEYNILTHPVGGISGNPDLVEINVSQTLANQDTAYLRFYIQGYSHYFWMIDDVALVEGKGLDLSEIKVDQGSNHYIAPFPILSPINYFQGLNFSAAIENLTIMDLAKIGRASRGP